MKIHQRITLLSLLLPFWTLQARAEAGQPQSFVTSEFPYHQSLRLTAVNSNETPYACEYGISADIVESGELVRPLFIQGDFTIEAQEIYEINGLGLEALQSAAQELGLANPTLSSPQILFSSCQKIDRASCDERQGDDCGSHFYPDTNQVCLDPTYLAEFLVPQTEQCQVLLYRSTSLGIKVLEQGQSFAAEQILSESVCLTPRSSDDGLKYFTKIHCK